MLLLPLLLLLLLLCCCPRSQGVRTSEQLTVGLLVMVVGCFLVDLALSKPPLLAVLEGMTPRLSRDSVYAAVCLLGANVMPHNFLLHRSAAAGGCSFHMYMAASTQFCWLEISSVAMCVERRNSSSSSNYCVCVCAVCVPAAASDQ
jgi:Mn2+/Fe2+ NRAMP family transporter